MSITSISGLVGRNFLFQTDSYNGEVLDHYSYFGYPLPWRIDINWLRWNAAETSLLPASYSYIDFLALLFDSIVWSSISYLIMTYLYETKARARKSQDAKRMSDKTDA
jgi:hypothetical protein